MVRVKVLPAFGPAVCVMVQVRVSVPEIGQPLPPSELRTGFFRDVHGCSPLYTFVFKLGWRVRDRSESTLHHIRFALYDEEASPMTGPAPYQRV